MPNPCSKERSTILDAMKADYLLLGSYDAVALLWGLSGAMSWKMIKERYYPKSKRIRQVIKEKAASRGIIITGRKRIRVDLCPDIGKEELETIRELSVKRRTEILINYIEEVA